jgi:tRNA(Ile)-lysidine synthase TilS/MesJ
MKNDALAHPPSHSFTSIGYFAKPMLKLRKKHIMKYLTSNSLEWREDDSNNSNKYKRNKIRNELLPLLSEITGGDRALQVRVSPNRCQIGFSSTWAEY